MLEVLLTTKGFDPINYKINKHRKVRFLKRRKLLLSVAFVLVLRFRLQVILEIAIYNKSVVAFVVTFACVPSIKPPSISNTVLLPMLP